MEMSDWITKFEIELNQIVWKIKKWCEFGRSGQRLDLFDLRGEIRHTRRAEQSRPGNT